MTSSDDPAPSVEDRELANMMLYRAMTIFHAKHTGRRTGAPLDVGVVEQMLAQMPALRSMMTYLEVGIAKSRIMERDRCIGIVEKIEREAEAAIRANQGDFTMNATMAAMSATIAREIREAT